MKKLIFWLLLISAAFGQQVNTDIVPASPGLKLGHTNQRWDANLQNVDITGSCKIHGQPCESGGGGKGSACITRVVTLSSACGTVPGTIASITDGVNAADCTIGNGTSTSVCIYNGFVWAPTGLLDPGGNGPIKRTGPNVTAPAVAADIIHLWIGGAVCDMTTFLRGDGQCAIGGGGGTTVFPGIPTGACTANQTAVNSANGDYYSCTGGIWVKVGPTTGSATNPGGSAFQIQANVAGTSFGGVSNAAAGSVLASAGASAFPVFQTKSVYDVRDFGVVGDSATDDTTALQSAITAACGSTLGVSPGSTITFPRAAQIKVTSTINVNNCGGLTIDGQSANGGSGYSSAIIWAGGNGGTVLSINRTRDSVFRGFDIFPLNSSNVFNIGIDLDENSGSGILSHNVFQKIAIGIPGSVQNSSFIGVRIGQNAPGNTEQLVFEDMWIGCGGGVLTNTSNGIGIQVNKSGGLAQPFYTPILRSEILNCSHGVEVNANARQVIVDGGQWKNFHSLYLAGGSGVTFQNSVTTQDASSSIFLNGFAGTLWVKNNSFTGGAAPVIDITNASGGLKLSVEDNDFGAVGMFTGAFLPGSFSGYLYVKGNYNFPLPCPSQATGSFGAFIKNVPASGTCDDVNVGTASATSFSFFSRNDGVQSSPGVRIGGGYQSAPATFATDYWQWQDVIGAGTNGTSTLTLTHSGTANAAPLLDLSANAVKFGTLNGTSGTFTTLNSSGGALNGTLGLATPANATVNNLTINGACTGCGGGGGSGTVTNIATTAPLTGGPATTTATFACPTCVTATVNPGAGVAHFAGATQTATSSGIVDADFAAGAVAIPHGGTNATTAPGALVNLLPAGTRIGDMLYCSAYSASACTTWSLVAGNTGSTQWLQQTASGVPSWTVPPGAGTVAVVGAGNLTSTALVTGGGTQLVQTPSTTSTLDASGNVSLAAGGSLGSADTGTPKFTFSTNTITANQKIAGTLFTGSTGFAITAATTAGHYLRNNGTNFVDSAILAGDLPSLSGTYLPLSGGTLNGNLLFTDASYDIGQPTTTRPRNLYVGGLSTSQVQAPVINATTGFQIGGAAPLGKFLTGTGTFYAQNNCLSDDGTTLSYTCSGGIAASSLSITSPFQIYSSLPAGAFSPLAGNSGFGVSNDGDWYLSNNGGTPYKIITTNSLTFDLVKDGTSLGHTYIIGTGSSLAPTSATVGSVIANNLIFGSTAIPTGTIPTSGQCLAYNGTNFTGAACSGGGGGTTTNAVTFNNGGAGAASGTTFDGSAARTISYNTLGAAASTAATTVNGQTCTLGSSCNVESAASGQVAISGGGGAALTGAADLTYNSGTHTFATTTAGIFDLSASTQGNGLIVPSAGGNIASAAGAIVFDSTPTALNYHGVGTVDSIFGLFRTSAVPTAGNVIDMGVTSTSQYYLHDSLKATANLVTAAANITQFGVAVGSNAAGKNLASIAVGTDNQVLRGHTGGNPTFGSLVTGDLPTVIPLANLATIGADFAVVNNTGSTAVPSAIAIGSCSSASNALTYNTTTHAFGCNTISGSGTVQAITSGHLYFNSTGTAVANDMGADLTFNTHTMTGGASLIFDLSALTGATNVKFPSGVPLTSPVLTTPALGTPSALVLTNATALPAAQVTAGTMQANMTLVTPALGAATATSLLASGIVDGTAPVTVTTGTSATLGAGTYKSGYTFNQEATAGTGVTYTLPATAVGLQYCVRNSIVSGTGAADTGILTVYPPASSYVILNGVRNTIGGGGTHGVASTGAAGDSACFVAVDATDWEVFVIRGTWAAN